ncbi:MAG: sacsin N-terminal ATP-binding-like domain-containing protein [Actinomycetes bacterium]
MRAVTEDPFGTAALREQVLSTWRASPDRFREDANAEEDLALGGYRDRLVVELAQNAADAAARAGVPGRLLLRLARTADGPLLVAANTGAALDEAGVRGLASLRASAKRDDASSVGRFGVGFAAVLAVTDEPVVVSHGRGVRFSRGDTLALVRDAASTVPRLAEELGRRDEHVPVLRLPFPADGTAPTGYDTAVLLPLRDGAAADLADRLLDEVDDALLLALPGLHEVVVERPDARPVRLADVTSRWVGIRREGVHPSELLAERPTEERARPGWSVTWAVPREQVAVPRVLHAPTPTDEPLDWPALLVATFPLDPSRRHVAPGAVADTLVAHCAAAYADLLAERTAEGEDALDLVPTGLPAGELDARLRDAVLTLLPAVPLLRSAEDGAPLCPRDAVLLEPPAGDDPAALEVLAPLVAGLVAAPRRHLAPLRALGVTSLALADLVEELPADPDPARWCRRYEGLAGLADDPVVREALAALPVPLADGRLVRGARGTVLPVAGVDTAVLAPLADVGLRVVHADAAASPAAARLLERLGARPVGPADLLADPAVLGAVQAAADAADDEGRPDLVDAVLEVVRAAVADGAGEVAVAALGDLPLEASDGEPAPAATLVLPGSRAAALLEPEEVLTVADAVVDRWGADVLEAVGVARTLSLVRAHDLDPADLPDELGDLDGAGDWAESLPPGVLGEVLAVRDLDVVRDDAWSEALALLESDPALRAAVTTPLLVRRPDGSAVRATPYTAWWLRRHWDLAGHADPDAEASLAALLPPAAGPVAAADAPLRRALGLPRGFGDLDAAGWEAVLRGLAEREVPVAVLLDAVAALGQAARSVELTPPDRLRVPDAGGGTVVAAAADVAVVDAPMWWQRTDLGPLLPARGEDAEAIADALDLDLASERGAGVVAGEGVEEPVPDAVRAMLPGGPATWREHEELTVDGTDVEWWVEGSGPGAVVHAVTVAGLARGLAHAAGRWQRRLAVEAVLGDQADAATVLVEEALA